MPTTFCRHVRVNGTRCNSPALRGGPLCYFHQRDRERYPNRRFAPQADATPTVLHSRLPGHDGLQRDPELLAPAPARPEFLFPRLEDRASIQIALSMLLDALGRDEIDPRRAGLMLYALQVASSNAKTLTQDPPDTVRETTTDTAGHDLAPDEDPEQEEREPSVLEQILDDLKREKASRQDLAATPGEGSTRTKL